MEFKRTKIYIPQNLVGKGHEGYITKRKHPAADLYIYNYTQKTQYEGLWNEYTLMCRGLILDSENGLVARPFDKFFNFGELALDKQKELFEKKFHAFDKVDGSLGILYFIDRTPYIATRGSFESDQAKMATKILHEKYSHVDFCPSYTYLFEIIYPENRIVVNYGDMIDLILLGARRTESSEEIKYDCLKDWAVKNKIPIVEKSPINTINKILEYQDDKKEGFVLVFEDGFKCKVKFNTYKRLHKILCGVSAKVIWEMLKNKDSFEELMHHVPDEFYDWVKKTKQKLQDDYSTIAINARNYFVKAQAKVSRKEHAEYFKKFKYPSILFKMLDGNDYSEMIWKIIKPEYSKPFKDEI